MFEFKGFWGAVSLIFVCIDGEADIQGGRVKNLGSALDFFLFGLWFGVRYYGQVGSYSNSVQCLLYSMDLENFVEQF